MSGTCRICASTKGSLVVLPELLYGTGEEFDYWHCDGCGAYQIVSVPEDMSRFYPSQYYSFTPARLGFKRTARLTGARLGRRFGLDLLRKTEALRPLLSFLPKSGGRVADIGSGTAQTMHELSLLGYDCTAVDPFVEVKNVPRGVRFLKGDMAELQGDFDLILMFDSLEHMADPHQAFADIARLLHPNGVAIVRVPVVPNNVWDTYGSLWLGLDPPRHLYTFTIESLHMLARDHSLVVRKINYDALTWSLAAARLLQEGKYESGSLSRGKLRSTPEDAEETRRANQERRGDAIYLQIVHPQSQSQPQQ
jgi:SAM-dependent methyltransferase